MKEMPLHEMIERYQKELMQFSKNSNYKQEETESDNQVIPVMATVTEPQTENDDLREEEVINPQPSDIEEITSLEGTNVSGYNAGREEKIYDTYESFLADNPGSGRLRVQAFTANQTFPATGANVEVYKPLANGDYLVHRGETDISGIESDIELPAPDVFYSQEFSDREPYASYRLIVTKDGYRTSIYNNLPIFTGIESVQTVNLVPTMQDGMEARPIVVDETEPQDL